jgi:hypothetical protein
MGGTEGAITFAREVLVALTMAIISGVGLDCPAGWEVQKIFDNESAISARIILFFIYFPDSLYIESRLYGTLN